MTGIAETTGLVVVIVAVFEGLMGLIKYLINKNSKDDADEKIDRIVKEIFVIKEKVTHLDEMHSRFDADGTPIWYVPRSWAETQEKINDRLYAMQQTQLQILGIIERLEGRVS